MRKKKHPEHVNHERWLVSYADFITLLFAFFVVMFAVSQVDSKKMGRFQEAFSKAVGDHIFPGKGTGLFPASEELALPQPQAEDVLPPELEGIREVISALAEKDSAFRGIQVVEKRNELVVRLADNIFFESGEDTLKPAAEGILRELAPVLAKRRVEVRVEGHTDTRPIRSSRFRSNWELSTSRATAVLLRLAGEGVPATRLAAAGYGEFRPIAPNDTDDGRRQNRRVELVLTVAVEERKQ